MVEDFTLFRQIEQTEFVDWIFELNSKFGTDNLTKFSELVNKETLWVVSEVVGETNLGKRVKLVKLFLKIAKQCKENQNYNSMFAITAGTRALYLQSKYLYNYSSIYMGICFPKKF